MPPFPGMRRNIHNSSRARWKACGELPICNKWTFAVTYCSITQEPKVTNYQYDYVFQLFNYCFLVTVIVTVNNCQSHHTHKKQYKVPHLQLLQVSMCTNLKENGSGPQWFIWYQHWTCGCGGGFAKPSWRWREAAMSWWDIADTGSRWQIKTNHSIIDGYMRHYCSCGQHEWIVNWHW